MTLSAVSRLIERMAGMATKDDAEERAARAIHESYFGKGTYAKATPADRSHARQALRLALSALHGDKPKLQAIPAPASRPPIGSIRPPIASPRRA
jgi:hypothetical protein